MNRKVRFFVAASVLVGAVAYLMYTGVSQTAVYYLTIGEFHQKKDELVNEGVRVAGRVQMGSVERRMTSQGEEIKFRMGDFTGEDQAGPMLPVHFVGIVPDMFKREGGSDVIVEGKYRDGVLYAHNVLTQCPSKYEPAEDGTAQAATR